MTYRRQGNRAIHKRLSIIAYCIEQYVNGQSICEIEKETGITSPTIGRYLTVHYLGYKGDNPGLLIRQSKINPIINKPKIVKKVKKPVYWTKGEYKSMPAQLHQDFQLKRILTLPQMISKY